MILKQHCILRSTQNIGRLYQGNVCILAEVPEARETSILVYVAPHVDSVMDPKLYKNNNFLNRGRRISMSLLLFVSEWGQLLLEGLTFLLLIT